MTTGSNNNKRTQFSFLIGSFGSGKSHFFNDHLELFPDAYLAGADEVADPMVEAINTPEDERKPEQQELLNNVTNLKLFLKKNNIINRDADNLQDDASFPPC